MSFAKSEYESRDIIIISYDEHLSLNHFNYGGFAYNIESNFYDFEYDHINNRLYLKYYSSDSINFERPFKVVLNIKNLEIYYKYLNGTYKKMNLIINSKGCKLK